MTFRIIKVFICAACLASSVAAPAQQPTYTLDIIDMAAISRMSPQQLEVLAEGLAAEEIMRTKRSSAQALSSVVSKASSGLQSKVGLLGQASAFISSASSKSGGHDEHTGYSYEPHDEKVDYWGLKKSILYTLFQAVKAITGGVTILKGQLIKGGGALATTLGKVIAVKGDAVSNLGKKIVSSAALSAKKPHSTPVYGPPPVSHVTHVESYPPSAYGAPTAPAHYAHSAPSAPSGYAAHKYPSHLDVSEMVAIRSVVQDIVDSEPKPMPPMPPIELQEKYIDLVDSLWETYKILNVTETDFFIDCDDLFETGRAKLNGVHAGVVILTPLGETPDPAGYTGHTPLEPPPSVLNTVYSAIKNAFSPPPTEYSQPSTGFSPPTTGLAVEETHYQPPPPPQSIPSFKPMSWGAVDSYGQPAAPDAFPQYDPRNPHPPFTRASSKHSEGPNRVVVKSHHGQRLSPDKIQKINQNLEKLNEYIANNIQVRSSEELPKFMGLEAYSEMLKKGQVPLFPTPVVTDNEIGVLSADILPDSTTTSTTPGTTTTTTTTTTTQSPTTESDKENKRERKDVKYFLRGNRIIVHG